jgi:hypothetical protein
MKFRCFVDGHEVAPLCLTRRVMNFGQGCPSLKEVVWSMDVDPLSLAAIARPLLEKLTTELKEDIEGGVDSPEEKALVDRGWPTFDQLLATDTALLAKIMHDFLAMELLDALLPHPFGMMNSPAFAIDSLTNISITVNSVTLRGIAYPFRVEALR